MRPRLDILGASMPPLFASRLPGRARGVTVLVLAAGLVVTATLPGAVQAAPAAGNGTPAVSRAARTAPVLGRGTVLFIDNHRIRSTGNVVRRYRVGTKIQVDSLASGRVDISPVLTYGGTNDAADGDQDVDSSMLQAVGTVLAEQRDGAPLYRMWLRTGRNTGYRESTDGLHWRVHDPDSVVVATGVTSPSVVKDPASGLYYLLGWSREQGGYVQLVSKDGISFKRTSHFSGVLSSLFGDLVQAASDPMTERVLAIAKQRSLPGRVCAENPRVRSGGRTFGTHVSTAASSTDAKAAVSRTWGHPSVELASDCTDVLAWRPVPGVVQPVQFYGMPFQRYGDQFIGLPWLFRVTAAAPSRELSGFADGPVDTQLASTPNPATTSWRRSDATEVIGGRRRRPAVIERGPRGAWDGGMAYGTTNLVTLGGRTTMYYTGWDGTHLPSNNRFAAIGAVQLRKDSMVGLAARDRRRIAFLRTRPFRLTAGSAGRDLRVNAQLGVGSWLRAHVVDARTGRVIPGYTTDRSVVVRGDRTDAVLRWRGRRISALGTRPVQVVFQWRSGSFWSFAVR